MATQEVPHGRPYSPGSLDVYNSLRRSGEATLDGYTDVRVRDAPQYTESKQLSSSYNDPNLLTNEKQLLTQWTNTRQNRMRPVIYQPTGSFQPLKDIGKLPPGIGETLSSKARGSNPQADSAYFLPGYTGFVRGSQHIAARTFGESTRRALTNEYREILCTSPIPSDPQRNRKIPQNDFENTYVSTTLNDRRNHVPGYTGFVAGQRATHGRTYGSATDELVKLNENNVTRTENVAKERQGFASTCFPRQKLEINSAPLPGGARTNTPPLMFIPSHIKYLQYIPM